MKIEDWAAGVAKSMEKYQRTERKPDPCAYAKRCASEGWYHNRYADSFTEWEGSWQRL